MTPYRVLSLDGGGMRGVYSATYLESVAAAFTPAGVGSPLDIGAAFDLIVGNSTGAIIACALAQGVPLDRLVQLYRANGRAIFPRPLPTRVGFGLLIDLLARPRALRRGAAALHRALTETFGDATLRQVHDRRGIALALTAVRMEDHGAWVFRAPQPLERSGRDDDYALVDMCLAASAAPLYRSLAMVGRPGAPAGAFDVFADGGLWANNPVLVALIEALERAEAGRSIEIFCLGTRPTPAGESIAKDRLDRGFVGWKFGADTMALAIDAQESAYDGMAQAFAKHSGRDCTVLRFPRGRVTPALAPYLGLDDTRPVAINALIAQARADAVLAVGCCGDPTNADGGRIRELFGAAPRVGQRSA